MTRDPFYQDIVRRLTEGPLDEDLFEQAAADLLRPTHPMLVPISGGSDAGMDGAFPDENGNSCPLVSTTRKDVIGNLTTNLNSYLEKGGSGRRAILATSQALSWRRKENLTDRARELGFSLPLHEIYDQEPLANLLYRDPKWCRQLLGLTGNPPALSFFPHTTRPLLDAELVGRKDDMEWLRGISGDRLLVGQPGSGKTFLLHKLAREGAALFAVSSDRGELANALREQQPAIIIVDDAHTQENSQLIRDLQQIRREVGAGFSILASCWPGSQDEVGEVLHLPNAQIRYLDLLTRNEIVEVVKSAGIYGPTELVRELVNQAEGRPGLAVTLAQLCLQGGVQGVAIGEALRRSIESLIKQLVGEGASAFLAVLSLGGDYGLPKEIAGRALQRLLMRFGNLPQNSPLVELYASGAMNTKVLKFALPHFGRP